MRIATHIEMMPWRGFDFGDPIAEMFARMFAFLRIVFTLGKPQLSGLSLALEPYDYKGVNALGVDL